MWKGTLGLIAMMSMPLAAASTARAASPVLYDVSPERVIVNLDVGQTSFECTGFAFDPDPADTVSFVALIAPFMTLDVMPGNPGSFRVHAENLTGEHYGGAYFVDVVAYDGHPGSSAGTSFAIYIIPEPGSVMALSLAMLFCCRSRSKSHV